MSFFDKFFSGRSRNNSHEHGFKSETETLKSSHLSISKDQIRFVLFRECDKRGRKLLFDSKSVEKVPLQSNMCNLKCKNQGDKYADFIEIYKTHAYKYKKPPNDVSSLGEMVFGSVAVVYKAVNSCKIHCIPSPKQFMFTTIVHAPFRKSPGGTHSDLNLNHSSGSSLASLTNVLNQQLTSSSDSKLYKHEGIAQKYSCTYPWMKHTFPIAKIKQCCEISDYNVTKTLFNNCEFTCSGNSTNELEKIYSESELEGKNFNLNQKSLDFEKNSLSNCGSSGITSAVSENISSISSSLSSLRRRWANSYSTSLDSTAYEDTNGSPVKKRTKLGMALIIDLNNTLENEIEKFIFNHTIVIDSIMYRLQDSVEAAYIRNENFVDLIYTAFLDCQDSIYKLIVGGKYETPLWCSVYGDPNIGLETQLSKMNLCKINVGTCRNQEHVQFKFLNDFCDVLVKFDTKDTNFFISTLLTAVLTHHLSWVNSIAETELEFPNENLSVIYNSRPYNPIWAQFNDLCGLLGSPLKIAKTVVTGPENKKSHLSAVVEILSYFIRCNSVFENVYEVDIEDIINVSDLKNSESEQHTNFETFSRENFQKCLNPKNCTNETVKSEGVKNEELKSKREVSVSEQSDVKKTNSQPSLKRNKSYLSRLGTNDTVKANELYPDIKALAKSEHVNIDDLVYEQENFVNFRFLDNEKIKEKVQKMIRVPNVAREKSEKEEYLSLDEGYDTIDSTKTDNFNVHKVQMERQRSAPESKKEDIVFLLGENEELVNLNKKVVVNKSSFVEMEKESLKEFFIEPCSSESTEVEKEKTFDGVDKTFWVYHGMENVAEHSKDEGFHSCGMKTPWNVREIKLPRVGKPCRTRLLEVSSVLGEVNECYHSEQIIQGVIEPTNLLETLKKDLFFCAHNEVLEKKVTEALCIVGDMSSWEVTILSSNKSVLDQKKRTGVRVGMSQLVADMLESLLYLHTSNLSPRFCLNHIEKKLLDIYLKSKTVAEVLNSTELCSIDYLTSNLDIGINDVPLLLSVATTHSPQIAEKYILSYS